MALLRVADFASYQGILFTFLLVLAAAPASGDELWTRLFEENLAKAQAGDAAARYEVGIMYLKGQGVAADRAQAIHWLNASSEAGNELATAKLRRMHDQEEKFQVQLAAAQSGDPHAQYDIAMMYLKGQGTDQERESGRVWLRRAAQQGDAKAITRLGILHYKGEPGEIDYAEARRLFEQVRDESVLAQYYLGEMYAAGHGVEKNYATAIDWYQQAAHGGFKRALGKIINLQEELKMEQRRDARTGRQQNANAAVSSATVPPVQRLEPPAAVAAAAPAKPAQREELPQSALQKLSAKRWLKDGEPVEFLPSEVTDCELEDEQLVCLSAILQRASGGKVVQFRVKSVIRSSEDSGYAIVYRNLVLDVTAQEQEDDDQPAGYDGAVDQGFHIQTGWTGEHSVECDALSAQGLQCLKDKAHRFSLGEG